MNLGQMVEQFNETYKPDARNSVAALPDPEALGLTVKLVAEEFQELHDAYTTDNKVEYFDALCDLIYVIAQQADLQGFPIQQGLEEVHRSNMSKLGEDGKPIIREDGKVLKSELFSEPNLKEILNGQTERLKTQES